jgi:hypothetical protein
MRQKFRASAPTSAPQETRRVEAACVQETRTVEAACVGRGQLHSMLLCFLMSLLLPAVVALSILLNISNILMTFAW